MGRFYVQGNLPSDGFAEKITAQVWRFDGNSGLTRVNAGFPLKPGMLTDADLDKVRVFVGPSEKRVALSPLRGKHPDGSYRALGIQFEHGVSSLPQEAEVWFNGTITRQTVDIAWEEPTQSIVGQMAVIAPTDPAYLCDTFVALQPLMPVADDVASVASWTATMEAQWSSTIANGTQAGGAIYDHALGCWAYFCRTGDPTWYEWAYKWGVVMGGPLPGTTPTTHAINFQIASTPGSCTNDAIWNPEVLTGSNGGCGGPSEAYSLRLWSAVASYWMTAYRQPMRYVVREVNRATWNVTSQGTADSALLDGGYGLRFNFGTKINSLLAGYLIEGTTEVASSGGVPGGNLDNYPQLFGWLLNVLGNNKYALGDYRDGMIGLKSTTTDAVAEGGTTGDWQNFQVAVVCEFLMMYYDLVDDDARIPVWLANIGNIIAAQVRASNSGEPGFPTSYVTPYVCEPSPLPTSGLTGWTLPMHAPLFAWLWANTGNTAWRDLCDNAIVPANITGLDMQTKLWGELWGGTRQAFAYYRNGGTVRGTTGVHPTTIVQPTTHAELG